MNGDDELRQEAADLRLDGGLAEVVGGERAPDVTAAVLARHALGEVVEDDAVSAMTPTSATAPRRGWLAAAMLMVLGAAAVVGALLHRGDESAAPASPGDATSPQDPGRVRGVSTRVEQRRFPVVEVVDRAAIATLPPTTKSVELRNLDDAAIAALAARLPELEELRVFASTAYYRNDDPLEPVSITDAALAAIGTLTKLSRLELVGTLGVDGSGLGALAALPMLERLELSFCDIGDAGLEVLPRLPSLRVLVLTSNYGFGAEGVAAIGKCPGLQRLDLHGCSQLTADALRPLAELHQLAELDLSIGSTVRGIGRGDGTARTKKVQEMLAKAERDGAGMRTEAIARWPQLRRIVLANCPRLGSDAGKALRERCPALEEVDVSGSEQIDDVAVLELLGLRRMQRLAIANCRQVSETVFDVLARSTVLREIVFEKCEWLSLEKCEGLLIAGKLVHNKRGVPFYDQALQRMVHRFEALPPRPQYVMVREAAKLAVLPPEVAYIELRGLGDAAALQLAKRPGLRGVTFVGDSKPKEALTDAGLRVLAGMPTLEELSLGGAHGITAAGLGALAELAGLRQLDLRNTDVGDDVLAVLPRLRALRTLWIGGVRTFGERGVAAIGQCVELRSLSLRHCDQLQGRWLAALAPLQKLETLDLGEIPGVDDVALQALHDCSKLETLVVGGPAITDRGLEALEKTALRSLYLADCPRITTEGLQRLPTTIVELFLGRCPGLDASAGPLLRDRFPGLGGLYIEQNDWVDDSVIAAVCTLPQLEELWIFDCNKTTVASRASLMKAPLLRKLRAMRVGWLTAEIAQELTAARPELRIDRQVW